MSTNDIRRGTETSAQSGKAAPLSPHGHANLAGGHPAGFPPASLADLHAKVGAVLVDDNGRLVDANVVALRLLDLDESSVGLQVGPQLAAIAIRRAYGPNNGVTPSPDVVGDRVQAFCLPLRMRGATLYMLWDPAGQTDDASAG